MTIEHAVASLGAGPLTESALREQVFPLFSRALNAERARGEIYLANHSLGRPLDQTAEDIAHAVSLWYRDMDAAWEEWTAESARYRASIARLIGRARPDAVVPKTSAGQGLRAVLNAFPTDDSGSPLRVVTTTGEFDSIDFILKTYVRRGRARVTFVPPGPDGLFDAGRLADAITPGTDLVVFSLVVFATGQVIEHAREIVERAHAAGAVVLVDTYHAAGAMPVDIDRLGADFAIGGNYKYTRGGPGACWLAIADRHLRDAGPAPADSLATLDSGWFAKRGSFSFERTDVPELSSGGDAWLESTPPFLVPYQARAGLELTLGLGVERLSRYSVERQALLQQALANGGVAVWDIRPRGAFLLVHSPDAPAAARRLRAAGVNTDARVVPGTGRGVIRLCPDILTTSDEIFAVVERIAALTLSDDFRFPPATET